MHKINIKPLSVNMVWQGRRFKTGAYKDYEHDLSLLLPKLDIPEGLLEIHVKWGLSSKSSDIDNPLKPFIDVLQASYDFNDKRVYRLLVEKEDVKRGEEFILFDIKGYPQG